jgi:hypothetical protein
MDERGMVGGQVEGGVGGIDEDSMHAWMKWESYDVIQ